MSGCHLGAVSVLTLPLLVSVSLTGSHGDGDAPHSSLAVLTGREALFRELSLPNSFRCFLTEFSKPESSVAPRSPSEVESPISTMLLTLSQFLLSGEVEDNEAQGRWFALELTLLLEARSCLATQGMAVHKLYLQPRLE